ncbi:HPF/RaiA family ribosome-associated protein [Aurantibacillus circumpalustris]|uniref:HPF/RaiA family ribosome-associated protein n=1 Tax=Aurantibacillus circumpalustris TaxID=3036359 RepID=UPI00295C0D4B|nr:HPF/RaiA family ribosome-associated protein [Aurantibacillus circumpalustris]
MKIQFNTDKTINGDERNSDYFTVLISEGLKRYSDHITRIEVHVTDENGHKVGIDTIRCLLEARLEGKKPMAVTCQADTIELAVSGAISKLNASLKTIFERLTNH